MIPPMIVKLFLLGLSMFKIQVRAIAVKMQIILKMQITEVFLQNVFQMIRATEFLIIQRSLTKKRNISIQNKGDNDNLQDTQNVNNVQCFNISLDIYIDVIDKKNNSD